MTSPRCREGTSLGAANRNGICFKSSNNQLGTLPCSPYPRTQWRMQLKTKSRGKQSCDQPTGVSFSLQTKQSLWEFWQEFDCSFTVWPRGTILCCQGLGCWQLHRFWQLQVASTSAWCLAGGGPTVITCLRFKSSAMHFGELFMAIFIFQVICFLTHGSGISCWPHGKLN